MAEGTPIFIVHNTTEFVKLNEKSEILNSLKNVTFNHPYRKGITENEDDEDPYVSLSSPGNLSVLNNAEEIVTPPFIVIEYSYPLKDCFYFLHRSLSPKGFTRAELAMSISNTYKKIYRDEENVSGNPGNISGMLNRAQSHGPYGIWGHGLDDLVLHRVESSGETKFNLPLYTLGIDS
jgi:hypothetical protein